MSKELQNREAETGKAPPQEAKAKKPYQKPAFRYDRVFETMALACGKLNGTQSQCRFNRKSS
ncbi:MAG: hypothetical protein ACLP1Y_07160 [Candidatus Acidiferrales bacterium]